MDRVSRGKNRFIFNLLSLAAFAAALVGSAAPAEAKIIKATMLSAANGRVVDYRVYTPPGYSAKAATRYPVVFSRQGGGGPPPKRASNFASTLDLKITSGEIMP